MPALCVQIPQVSKLNYEIDDLGREVSKKFAPVSEYVEQGQVETRQMSTYVLALIDAFKNHNEGRMHFLRQMHESNKEDIARAMAMGEMAAGGSEAAMDKVLRSLDLALGYDRNITVDVLVERCDIELLSDFSTN